MSNLEDTAKTIYELMQKRKEWLEDFSAGALGNQEAYARARDNRSLYEQGVKYVPLVDAQKEIAELNSLLSDKTADLQQLTHDFGELEGLKNNFERFYNEAKAKIEAAKQIVETAQYESWESFDVIIEKLKVILEIPRKELKEKPECATCGMCQCDVRTNPNECYLPNWKAPRSDEQKSYDCCTAPPHDYEICPDKPRSRPYEEIAKECGLRSQETVKRSMIGGLPQNVPACPELKEQTERKEEANTETCKICLTKGCYAKGVCSPTFKENASP
jgi:hypothetical protein